MKKRTTGRMTVREKLHLMKQIEDRNKQRRKLFASANKTANNRTNSATTEQQQKK